MKVGRRLVLLAAALAILGSAWFQWFGLWPAQVSLDSLLTRTPVSSVAPASVTGGVTLAILILVLVFIALLCAVTGNKIICLVSIFVSFALIGLVFSSTSLALNQLTNFQLVGNGPLIVAVASVVTLVTIIWPNRNPLPRKK